jgi:hypothetical protein
LGFISLSANNGRGRGQASVGLQTCLAIAVPLTNPCTGIVCPAGECEVAGSCADGVCSATADGIACDDGDAATNSDVCTSGQCAGSATPPSHGLFITEIAEGSSNNTYIEFYNPTDDAISLDGYAYPSTTDAARPHRASTKSGIRSRLAQLSGPARCTSHATAAPMPRS